MPTEPAEDEASADRFPTCPSCGRVVLRTVVIGPGEAKHYPCGDTTPPTQIE